ncbi:MAG TPA: HWE histidine kinase domain-containing protein [Sphingomonadaceae bacterium]|nr:HWE histidine kinase domain-containing protein [Sphingomonadaceae bacterium]
MVFALDPSQVSAVQQDSTLSSGTFQTPEGRRLSFLEGGGRAARAIFARDWTDSPLGPIEGWPRSLRTALGMMLSSSFPKAITWGPTHITFHNDAFEPILGEKPDAIGRPFSEVWAEVWQDIKPMVDKAYAGVPSFGENYPLVINRHGYSEEAYFTFCYSPIRDDTGAVAGMMATVIETTEVVRTQRQLALLNGELAHRMRNMLTMVTAIADMSLRHAATLEEGREALGQRLAALGQAQSFLVNDADIDTEMGELVACALAPHSGLREHIRITGPGCRLRAKPGLALALVLNELLTNSIKYGALANGGMVRIAWDTPGHGDDRLFSFTWTESGAGPATPPDHEGFGTKILTRFAPLTFRGEARIAFEAGLTYQITAPYAANCIAEGIAGEALADG